MTAEFLIKKEIIEESLKNETFDSAIDHRTTPLTTEALIETVWNDWSNSSKGNFWDAKNAFRESGEDSGIPSRQHSRYYESDEVARQLNDGTWVGWTYWHGGGKHGEPEAIDWIESAYFPQVKEEIKTLTVRTFSLN